MDILGFPRSLRFLRSLKRGRGRNGTNDANDDGGINHKSIGYSGPIRPKSLKLPTSDSEWRVPTTLVVRWCPKLYFGSFYSTSGALFTPNRQTFLLHLGILPVHSLIIPVVVGNGVEMDQPIENDSLQSSPVCVVRATSFHYFLIRPLDFLVVPQTFLSTTTATLPDNPAWSMSLTSSLTLPGRP